MTTEELQRLIAKKANDFANRKYPTMPESSQKGYFVTPLLAEPYVEGFRECARLMMPLVAALEFECGNRCANQNPCNAKEALQNFERELGR